MFRKTRIFRFFLNLIKLIPFSHFFKVKTYSQSFEDLLIANLVGEKIGSYIDVGSGLPCFGSNTYRLYKRGWSGILIDPIPRNIRLSKFFRKRDLCLNIGVSDVKSELHFFHLDPYELSSFNKDIAQERLASDDVRLKEVISIPVMPLSDIVMNRSLKQPLVLSIDTEGFEMQVLKGIDWNSMSPTIVCIEEFDNPINIETEVKKFLLNQGFKLIFYNGLSSIYTTEDNQKL